MSIDASIPLQGKQLNLGDIMEQAQQMRFRQTQMDEYERKRRQQAEQGDALSALIADPNGMKRESPAFQRYAQADPTNAFALLKDMDEQQRKHVEAGTKDLAAAVQWADTPEKWAVVQKFVAQHDPAAAQTPFEHRQEVLIQLGQMGEYLKNTAPKIITPEAGGGAFAYTPGQPMQTLIRPNPGDQQMGAPAGAGGQPGGVREGATATNPQTGQKIMFQGGQWVPVGGGAGNGTGGFRP